MATKYEFNNCDLVGGGSLFIEFFLGQSFTVGTTGTNESFNIYSIKLKLGRVGNPGIITIALRAVDESGFPTGDDLSTGTTNGDTLSIYGEIREINMSSYELQASTKYSILFKSEFSSEENNCILYINSEGSTYNGGTMILDDDGYWIDLNFDTWFEIWGTAISTGTNCQINIGDGLNTFFTEYVE